jgi:hypothetical protein
MQGCKAAYVQSDEASLLLTDFDELAYGRLVRLQQEQDSNPSQRQ